MNRELKFRVWDYRQNRLEYFELADITVPGRLLTQDKFPVQQHIDLKDKNGKEIYEGDLIRFGYTENKVFFGEVKWLEDRASFGVVSGKSFQTMEDLMDYMSLLEVVGNIYELPCNPDHNGECLVCDCWLSDCPFLTKNT